MNEDQKPVAESGTERDVAGQRAGAAVDIAKLADMVQRLLLDELRLERARGAQHGRFSS
jgi:hypothetical protein